VPPCGNGKLEYPETCDDGGNEDGDGCSEDCHVESRHWSCVTPGVACVPVACGDHVTDDVRELCDDGNQDDGDGCSSNCVTEVCDGGACREPRCGDGFRDPLIFIGLGASGDFGSEACDDGNETSGDGCSADCRSVEFGWECPEPGTACHAAYCGDGIATYLYEDDYGIRWETCDDGNDVAGDGCNECLSELETRYDLPSVCGDHQVERGEFCDDGNDAAGDGCFDCRWEAGFKHLDLATFVHAPCGNGVLDEDVWNGCESEWEACDDGNTENGDGCDSSCELEPFHSCPTPGEACVAASCGDGVVSSYVDEWGHAYPEKSDPGVGGCPLTTDPYPFSCTDEHGSRECNDHNQQNGDGCTTDCRLEPPPWVCPGSPPYDCHQAVCGDHTLESSVEQCDDGNQTPGDGCSADCRTEVCNGDDCRVPHCGDGKVESIWVPRSLGTTWLEECDDGNVVAGDGCNADCRVEPGFACQDAGVPCTSPPVCGDGVVTGRYFVGGVWHYESCDDGNDTACDGCTDCQVDGACHPAAPANP